MHPSKILLFVLLSFIGGLFISSFISVPAAISYEILFLGIFYAGVAWFFIKQPVFRKAVIVFGICLVVVSLGLWQGSKAKPLEYAGEQQDTGYFSFLKQRFQAVIDKNLSPPQSQILSAILLGNKSDISKEFKEKLNIAGVRHITAISGMHIVILSWILMWLGIALGLHRGQTFYFAVIILWLFIAMIGFPASAVRAGVMGSMFLLAEKLGRQKTADRALLLTASVMLLHDPSLLRYSAGFQLSFLAALGIIYLTPFFQNLLKKGMEGVRLLPWKESDSFQSVVGLLAMSFSAQIFVLPLLIYYFGYFSVVSPLTNLLVVPILPYLMTAGFLFLILGALWQPLAFILLFPVWFLLTYITKITELFASFSFASIGFHLHWLCLPVVYGLLAIAIWQIKKRQKTELLP